MNDSHGSRRFSKKAGYVLAGAGVIAATALGVGGTYSLWHDQENVTGKIGSAQIGFGIGEVGNVNRFSDNGSSVNYSFGKDAAKTLLDDGKYAHAVQIDGATNGKTGLDYTTKLPDLGTSGIFSQADVKYFFVDDPSKCTTDVDPAAFDGVDGSARHLIAAGGSGTQKKTNYLCIKANLDKSPDGQYDNTGTVSGTDENGGDVSADSTWSATVNKKFGDPANEQDHTITFDPEAVKVGA